MNGVARPIPSDPPAHHRGPMLEVWLDTMEEELRVMQEAKVHLACDTCTAYLNGAIDALKWLKEAGPRPTLFLLADGHLLKADS